MCGDETEHSGQALKNHSPAPCMMRSTCVWAVHTNKPTSRPESILGRAGFFMFIQNEFCRTRRVEGNW